LDDDSNDAPGEYNIIGCLLTVVLKLEVVVVVVVVLVMMMLISV